MIRKLLYTQNIAFLLPISVFACDICGCGVGNQYIGILPEYQSSIVGTRYRNSSLLSHYDPSGNASYLQTKEIYQTADIYIGVQFIPKWRFMLTLPVHFIQKNEYTGGVSKSGLGDANLSIQREVLNYQTSFKETRFVMTSWVGVGIKAPLGKYETKDESQLASVNLFQLGSGSWDFLTQWMFDARLQDWGLNLNTQYKINTTNQYDYYFGNKLTFNAQVYKKWSIGMNKNISPNIGINYENSQMDIKKDIAQFATGGIVVKGAVGVEFKFNKLFLGTSYQPVMIQNIGIGNVKLNDSYMVHIGFQL